MIYSVQKDVNNYKIESEITFTENFIQLFEGKVRVGNHLTGEQKIKLMKLLEKFANLIVFNDRTNSKL